MKFANAGFIRFRECSVVGHRVPAQVRRGARNADQENIQDTRLINILPIDFALFFLLKKTCLEKRSERPHVQAGS